MRCKGSTGAMMGHDAYSEEHVDRPNLLAFLNYILVENQTPAASRLYALLLSSRSSHVAHSRQKSRPANAAARHCNSHS
jgi:hypothetical protein